MTLDDATAVLRSRGLDVHPHGYFEGGEVGAADVRTADGQTRYVLKWRSGSRFEARRAAALVGALRLRGYPAPQFVVAEEYDGVVFMMQEFAPGEASDIVPPEVVGRLIELNRLQVGAAPPRLAAESFAAYIERSLAFGCDGYCVHKSLENYSRETRRLLDVVRDAADGAAGASSDDVVHIDFHHRNVLRVGDYVTAVVDWEGCRPGDAAFDLVTLAFGLSLATVSAAPRVQVWDEVVARSDVARRVAYAAHMALRQVDWSIRHRTAADVDHWLQVSSEYLSF